MAINTNLKGRVGNTQLPRKDGLLPLFEAVVNSIQSIDERSASGESGIISIEVLRAKVPSRQETLDLDDRPRRGAQPLEPISGFKIIDNGVGFNDANMESFETLDSGYKARHGCRGVGRLLWLKAFARVDIDSIFRDGSGTLYRRSFSFTTEQGIGESTKIPAPGARVSTCVHLEGFHEAYRAKCAKTTKTIADMLLEHCLWYFVREGGAPQISIQDGQEFIKLDDVYEEYMFSSARKQSLEIKGQLFELTHIKLRANSANRHFIAWCAASRVVEQENITSKVPGLHGKIREGSSEYYCACYVSSAYLDQHVRPERIGFDIEEAPDDGLFSLTELSMSEIRKEVLASVADHVGNQLTENQRQGRERAESFVAQKAPKYRPILARLLDNPGFDIDPEMWLS